MAEFITTPYVQCISYKQGFNLDKGEKHTIQVDHTKTAAAATIGNYMKIQRLNCMNIDVHLQQLHYVSKGSKYDSKKGMA